MDNTNIILAANIQKYRKKSGLTQEELAEKLGITAQSISKWENAKSVPDALFLATMSDLFDCYIDELFSRNIEKRCGYVSELPWGDDNVIRGVVYEGRKMLQATDNITEKFTFEVIGDAKGVQSECNISVSGSVSEGCVAGGEAYIGCHLSGGCTSGAGITVGGHLSGGCTCGADITCGGNFSGDVNCGGTVTVKGDVKGNISCNAIKCERIEGDVTINK